MKLDNKGQITVELILILSFIIIIIISITSIAGSANELNMAMLAAEQGAFNGASGNGMYSHRSPIKTTQAISKSRGC